MVEDAVEAPVENVVEDAVEDAAVEKPIEDEVANAVEDPGYGKRAIELNYTCANPEMVRGDTEDVTLAIFRDNLFSLSFYVPGQCSVRLLQNKKLQSRDGYSDGARSTQPFGF